MAQTHRRPMSLGGSRGALRGVLAFGCAAALFLIILFSSMSHTPVDPFEASEELLDQIPVRAVQEGGAPHVSGQAVILSRARGPVKRPRVMLLVPLSWPPKRSRTRDMVEAMIRIYGGIEGVSLRFLVPSRALRRSPDIDIKGLEPLLIEVPFQRTSIEDSWQFTWRAWRRVAELEFTSAEWFTHMPLKSFVVPTHLAAIGSYLNADQPHYLGHIAGLDSWDAEGVLFNTGVIALSRGALRLLYIRLAKFSGSGGPSAGSFDCADALGNVERRMGACLREVGVEPSESRTSQGHQRFLLGRPHERAQFRKAAPYPVSFRGVPGKQQYDTLEYYTMRKPYSDPYVGVEPPSGLPFRGQVGSGEYRMDSNGNNPQAPPARRVGAWLQGTDAPECIRAPGREPCKCTVVLPSGLGGNQAGIKPCRQGATLVDGERCAVACNGEGSGAGVGAGGAEASCHDGVLVLPPLACAAGADNAVCKIPKAPNHARYSPDSGYLSPRQQLTVTCDNGFAMPGGRASAKFRCFGGEIDHSGPLCQQCGTWTLVAVGRKYQLPSWKNIQFRGTRTDAFEVIAVTTGSKEDPVKNCAQYGQAEQLILVEKVSGELVAPLSCANQEIEVASEAFVEGPCKG